MRLTVCATDEDYEAWRAVHIAVVPGERCSTVAELQAEDSPSRLLLLAGRDGDVVGCGVADRSATAGVGFAAPMVRPDYRREGVGSALLRALAQHCAGVGLPMLGPRSTMQDRCLTRHVENLRVDRDSIQRLSEHP